MEKKTIVLDGVEYFLIPKTNKTKLPKAKSSQIKAINQNLIFLSQSYVLYYAKKLISNYYKADLEFGACWA